MAKLQKPSSLPFDDERIRSRGFVDLAGTVRELQGKPAAVRVTDLSAKGCRLSGSDLPARAEVWVTIDGYNPIRGTVIWQKRGDLGCEFYGTPTKEKSARAASPPLYASAGPHPLRARLRGESSDE